MNAREKAESLRQEAIRELLTERGQIDEELKRLGHGKGSEMNTAPSSSGKRRGRPPKSTAANVVTVSEEPPP